MLVDNKALAIAAELSDSPDLILPHIKSRLTVNQGEDGQFTTAVLDAQGKLSATTIEELAQEFRSNEKFAPAIRAGKSSGGGAREENNGGAGSKEWSNMSRDEKLQLMKTKP